MSFYCFIKRIDEPAIVGTDFNVLKNIEGHPVEVEVLGWPGTSAEIILTDAENYTSALLDGNSEKTLLKGKKSENWFSG